MEVERLATSTSSLKNVNDNHCVIDCLQELVQTERRLSLALDSAYPLLSRPTAGDSSRDDIDTIVNGRRLSTPQTMEEVQNVLSMARSLSSRTSAAAGWNPMLPVVTFATPNPLPHQLRGGALGAMQLQMARRERQQKRDILKEKEEREKVKNVEADGMMSDVAVGGVDGDDAGLSNEERKRKWERTQKLRKAAAVEDAKRRKAAQEKKKTVSMNLSDSSSEEKKGLFATENRISSSSFVVYQ
mmetsp:Transcript_17540/g.20228  ORF Transcript_17540/g.20228 Transcript_17540/m.20228 type:complete len:243 (+) Transcript_17540:77-805(+)